MKKIFLSIIVLGSLYSCNLEREPYDGAITDKVVVTEAGLGQYLNGIYSKLGIGSTSYLGNSVILNLYRNGTFGSDEIHMSSASSDDMTQFYTYLRNATGARMNAAWNDGLSSVFATNTIFENMQEGKSQELDHMLGEAYYLRAFANYAMLMSYSFPYSYGRENKGIILKTTTNPDDRPLRSTVGESYDAVVRDLLKAEKLMSGDSKNGIKATQAAAQALLSRVYLYMEQDAKALEYAEKVINNGRYTLVTKDQLPTYAQSVPELNTETIFAFRFENRPNQYAGGSMLGSMYAVISNEGWGEMYATDSYIQQLNKFPEDARNKFITRDLPRDDKGKEIKNPIVYWTFFNSSTNRYEYQTYTANVDIAGNYVSWNEPEKDSKGNIVLDANKKPVIKAVYPILSETVDYGGTTYVRKYSNYNGGKQYLTCDLELTTRGGFPKFYINKLSYQEKVGHLYSPVVSRLAEMYLIRAEVKAKAGNVAGALADINIIRKRAGAPEFSSLPAGKTALDMVLEERWLEFAFEGHRKFDLLRNKRPIVRQFPGISLSKFTIQPSDPEIISFVPQREINLQPGLQQND